MKTIKTKFTISEQEAEMRKESFKQGRWAEQKHVLGLIDERIRWNALNYLHNENDSKCQAVDKALRELKARITG